MTKPLTFLGIDPGLDGGLAFLADDGDRVHTMPTLKGKRRSIDAAQLTKLVRDDPPDFAAVEEVSAAPCKGRVQGTMSMFSFGRGLGIIEGILTARGIPYVLVRPQEWKGHILAGTSKDKQAAIRFCKRWFPAVSLIPQGCRVDHDGLADALCIGEYGRRLSVGRILQTMRQES